MDNTEQPSTPSAADLFDFLSSIYPSPMETPRFFFIGSGLRQSGLTRPQMWNDAAFEWARYSNGVDAATRHIARQIELSREVYFSAHLFETPERVKDHAAPLCSLWSDLDAADPAHFPPGIPRPSLVLETSPGRFQAFWFLTEELPPAEGETLNRQLTYAIPNADHGGWALTKYLRIPGAVNHKYTDRPVVRIVERSVSR